MSGVSEAIDKLRAALQKNGVEIQVQDAFDSLASCLVLLNSSSPSAQMMQKLCSVLRRPFLPLYDTCFQPALQLSSRVLSVALGRLCDAHIIEDGNSCVAWDAIADAILSGILDFLDQKNSDDGSNGADWQVLYRTICEFFFLDSGRERPTSFSTTLCLSAYNTLTEVAARQITVRDALRQRDVLGGERLGTVISGTRDYLLLEALLTLFARLLHPTHLTSQGKFRRFKFVKEVLGSKKLFKCSPELLDIMQKTVVHWDEVAAKIIDVLAKTDITYPQPFSIDEIHVCGRVFPQPLATDRLVMDKHAFLVNIVAENNDTCESLQVPYSRVRTITLDNSEENVPKGKVSVVVYLMSAPLIAKVEMKCTSASALQAKFLLQSDAVARFMEALRRRGVGKLSFLNPLGRVDGKRRNISIGSGFRFTNDSSPIPPTASFEGKVHHVNQVYKTDIEDPTMLSDPLLVRPGDTHSAPMLLLGNTTLVSESVESATTNVVPFPPEESKRTEHLFDGVDELSELTDIELDNGTASERAESRTSASRSFRVKRTRHWTDRMRMNDVTNDASDGSKPSSAFDSKNPECTEGRTKRTPKARKPSLTSDSSMFGPSSSTRIAVSPRLASNTGTHLTTVDLEVVDNLSDPSVVFIGPDGECDVLGKELGVQASKQREKLHSANGKLGKRTKHLARSSDANQKEKIDLTKDTSVQPRLVGNHRKRESTRISGNAVFEADEACSPPRKKRRGERPAIDDDGIKANKTQFDTIPPSKAKGRLKIAVNFDEAAEFRPVPQRSRRSSRIRKRKATTAGPRNIPARGEIQETQQANDTDIGNDCGAVSIHSARPNLSTKDSSITIDNEVHPVKPRITRSISPETILQPETPKGGNSLVHLPGQHITKNFDCIHEAASHTTQEQSPIQADEFNYSATRTETSKLPEVVESSVSLRDHEEHAESPPPILEPASRKERITIDLTIDESSAREESGLCRASVAHVQTKTGTPAQPESVVTDTDPPPIPRRRACGVTFASPIEYVLEKKGESRTDSDSSSTPPPKTNTLSPLRIPTKTVGMRPESSSVMTRFPLQNLKRLQEPDRSVDDVDIPDIVEVLNEIQAVIIKGISNKFKDAKKEIRSSRDELIQQVLDELRGMDIENAKYFNGLLRLEEDYHRHCNSLSRCWEELIDFDDNLAAQFQNALKEHDKNVSARVYPKSLLAMQPIFTGRPLNV